ncbi:MAG: HAMP domain-containing protein [Roseateles sp.]|nr:MAG: HAMP domain-containing protein [Roseateles sp.]
MGPSRPPRIMRPTGDRPVCDLFHEGAMKLLNSFSIGTRLTAVFVTLIAVSALSTGFALYRLSVVSASLRQIDSERLPMVQRLVDMTDQVNAVARGLRNALIFEDSERVQAALAESDKQAREIADSLEALKKAPADAEARERLQHLEQSYAAYLPLQARFVALVKASHKEEAGLLLVGELRDAQLRYMADLDGLKDLQTHQISVAAEQGEQSYAQARLLLLGLFVLLAAGSLALARAITRSITLPLQRAVEIAETVARGDLSSAIQVDRSDEAGRLLHALKTMNQGLSGVVQTVRMTSEAIAAHSSQIAAGNADLSERTERQAVSLEQTAATMEQLTATVQQNAAVAARATTLAARASSVASEGGSRMGEVVQTMATIASRSQRMTDIVGVIDALAFQTNLLALNAAVEAARAGDSGRGFAVVAGEVRHLAARSAEAAREIRQLIAEGAEAVQDGSTVITQAGATMQAIVTQVRQVSDLIAEIATASSEQSLGISQVGEVVAQLDDVTQQNASLVVQGASAVDDLRGRADELSRVVAVFRTAEA